MMVNGASHLRQRRRFRSYTVDTGDGYVTEYDEDGEEVGSGY